LITGNNYFKTIRKPLGLYAFMYVVVHFVNFMVFDYGLVTRRILRQFIEKPFIWFGLTTLIILTLLALTSYKWWKVKMGKNWKRLHQLVYAAGVVVVLHDALAQKANLLQFRGNILLPVIYGSIIAILLIIRLPWVKRWILDRRLGKGGINPIKNQAVPPRGKPEAIQNDSSR
jgi:sulfoxide reductase heme-binding subunit YedZ